MFLASAWVIAHLLPPPFFEEKMKFKCTYSIFIHPWTTNSDCLSIAKPLYFQEVTGAGFILSIIWLQGGAASKWKEDWKDQQRPGAKK